jgi:hypothetical protein
MVGLIIAFALGAAFVEAVYSRRWIAAGCFGVASVINALAAFGYYS